MPTKLQEKADAYVWEKKRIYLEFTNSKLFLAKIFFSKQLFGGFLSFHRWVSRCKENERFEA